MKNLKKQTKKKLWTKILIVLGFALILALFCVVIAQTVKINRLQNELKKANETYQSESVEKE